MRLDAAYEIGRNTEVKCPVALAGEDVDEAARHGKTLAIANLFAARTRGGWVAGSSPAMVIEGMRRIFGGLSVRRRPMIEWRHFNFGRMTVKKIWLSAAVIGFLPALGLAQTTAELVNDGKNTDNVTTQSMGFDRKSYSPLKQIDKANIKRLVPIWNTSLMNDQGELAAPTVYNGVMYVINSKQSFAIDVDTGKQIWRTPVKLESEVKRLVYNRGAATIYNGKLFRVTIDNHVLALDMKTGKELWNQKFADAKEGYYSTSAPIIANGVLISGVAGGESTTRGFLDGWDPDTGK